MSVFYEEKGEPTKVIIDGQHRTVRQILTTYKLVTDNDVKDFIKAVSKGGDVLMQTKVGEATFIVVRKMDQIKIAI